MDEETPTAQRLFARVLIAEVLGRVALTVAMAGRSPGEQRRLLDEIQGGLVINITGENAAEVRELMHRQFSI